MFQMSTVGFQLKLSCIGERVSGHSDGTANLFTFLIVRLPQDKRLYTALQP